MYVDVTGPGIQIKYLHPVLIKWKPTLKSFYLAGFSFILGASVSTASLPSSKPRGQRTQHGGSRTQHKGRPGQLRVHFVKVLGGGCMTVWAASDVGQCGAEAVERSMHLQGQQRIVACVFLGGGGWEVLLLTDRVFPPVVVGLQLVNDLPSRGRVNTVRLGVCMCVCVGQGGGGCHRTRTLLRSF